MEFDRIAQWSIARSSTAAELSKHRHGAIAEALVALQAAWRPATRPISFLWASLAAGAGLNALSQLILVRHLEPAAYGSIAAAFSATAIISPLASLGVGGHLLQRFGHEGATARRWLQPSAVCLAISTALAATALTVWSLTTHTDAQIRYLTVLLIPWCVMQSTSGFVYALCQVEGLYPQLAIWQLAPSAVRFAAACAAYGFKGGGAYVAGATSFAAAAVVMGQALTYRKLTRAVADTNTAEANRPPLRSVLSGSWPYAASGSLFLIYYQSDIFILAWLRSPLESAPYAAASLVLTLIYHLPAAVYLQYLAPKLNRWAWHDPVRMKRVQGLALALVTLIGVLSAVVIVVLAPRAAATLFGPSYADAGVYLRWLALGIPLRYLSIGLGAGLVSPRQVRLRAGCQAVTAAVNITMNLLLIPRYGALAAVASTIASELVLVSTYYWTRRATQ